MARTSQDSIIRMIWDRLANAILELGLIGGEQFLTVADAWCMVVLSRIRAGCGTCSFVQQLRSHTVYTEPCFCHMCHYISTRYQVLIPTEICATVLPSI